MSTEIALPPQPGRIGQATAVEQTRAAAEVHAAVVVAQQCPRNLQVALAEMRQSCAQQGLAERAFFRYSRGGSQVTGATVHLARELARCWGNVQYGVAELRRDDEHGQSEMQAYAWDVQTNSRSSTVFIVPHARDTRDGRKPLVELRDLYENNANNAARRVRECIFGILPPWFIEEAKDLCAETIKKGDGKRTLAQRIADVIKTFEGIGVTAEQLERKVERASTKWTEHDIAALWVIGKSIERGETRREEEFPQELRATAEDIERQAAAKPATKPKPAAAPPAEPEPPAAEEEPAEPEFMEPVEDEPAVELIDEVQGRKLVTQLKKLGVLGEPDRCLVVSQIVRREVATTKHLTSAEAAEIISSLAQVLVNPEPLRALDAMLAALSEGDGA